MSDHSLITVIRTFKHKKVPPRFISTRSFKNFNEEAYLNDLGDLDWSGVLNAINDDAAADMFSSNVLSLKQACPMCEAEGKEFLSSLGQRPFLTLY